MSLEPPCLPLQAFLLFHLNLGFSTLEVEDRRKVIDRCYEPMLQLAEDGGRPIAVELSGWTLTQLVELAPDWVGRLRTAIGAGRVELVGSGWAQIIGPLVPQVVNVRNQGLGRQAYLEILGVEPSVALVNEMAFSSGLVDVYVEAGYSGLVLDRENARGALGTEDEPAHVSPSAVRGPSGVALPVAWSDTVLFQRFQRVVHGEIAVKDYLAMLRSRVETGQRVLPIYTNDVEVFGHRPGRFMTEAALNGNEWARITDVLVAVDQEFSPQWVVPSAIVAEISGGDAVGLTNTAHPVVVKKQRKYNLNRWALSGRDDLRLNTAAHRLTEAAVASGGDDPATWRDVCELWSSDLRTHLTESRWMQLRERLDGLVPIPEGPMSRRDGASLLGEAQVHGADPVILDSRDVRVVLDPRRGGVIRSLAFRSHGFEPCLGTVPQGTFSAIDVAVDFYTGGAVLDLPEAGKRLTNLEPCHVDVQRDEQAVRATSVAGRSLGGSALARAIVEIAGSGETVVLRTEVGPERPRGSVRVGHLTLLPQAFPGPRWLETRLGGAVERFSLDRDIDHGAPVSMLVSSTTSLAGAGGEIRIGDDVRALMVRWDPAECAAVPMLHHRSVGGKSLTRLFFSLSELDDTHRAGGVLLPFTLRISAG